MVMRNFFVAMFVSISSLFSHQPKQIEKYTPVATESTEIVMPTVTLVAPDSPVVNKPTNYPTRKPSVTPTKILHPTTSITEDVLRNFFGLTEKASIDRIMNSPDMIREYDKYFLSKFQKFPVPKFSITSPTQQIAVPREIKGEIVPAICTGEQLTKVYSDLKKYEEEVAFLEMDSKCHRRGADAEIKECQDWRRDNDQNRSERLLQYGIKTSDPIDYYRKQTISSQRGRFNELTGKYCTW